MRALSIEKYDNFNMLTATADTGVSYQTFTLHHTKYICLSTYALMLHSHVCWLHLSFTKVSLLLILETKTVDNTHQYVSSLSLNTVAPRQRIYENH
jgi:hypothetical protein